MHTRTNQLRLVLLLMGVLLFSFFIHANLPLRIVGIIGFLCSVWIIVSACDSLNDLLNIFQLKRSSAIYLLLGVLLGVAVSMFYRNYLNATLLPRQLASFALIAASIGMTEELFFRGYFQYQLSKYNQWLAVVVAAMAHTIYKALLFVSPFSTHAIDVWFLVLWTFAVGLLFGLLTKYSKSVWPAVVAHALFDVLVYGQFAHAPWWVW